MERKWFDMNLWMKEDNWNIINKSILNIDSWTLMALSTHLNWCINDLKNIYIRYTWIDALIV